MPGSSKGTAGSDSELIRAERLSALGQMASGVAHDFNNQLSMVLGYSDLLLMDAGTLDNRALTTEYLELIKTAAQDAAEIVRRLRSFYRFRDSGEEFSAVALSDVVDQAASLTRPRWAEQARANGLTIELKTELTGASVVLGNPVELREVLTNLIFNAVDAMEHSGTITVSTFATTDSVTLAVADTGAGMSEETRRRCMEPFFTTKGDQGTGLGLGLVYGIVRRHEGSIDIASEIGVGTAVTVTLPAAKPAAAAVEAVGDPSVPIKPLSVLVVDDEPKFCNLLSGFLVADGHRVELAKDGPEGLQRFLAGHFDVVMLDQAMPHMSGTQLALSIKRIVPDKPVVLLTGFKDAMAAEASPQAAVDVIMGKPITLQQLRQTLAQITENS